VSHLLDPAGELNFIAGSWQQSGNGNSTERRNPGNLRDLVGIVPDSDEADVDAAVSAAATATPSWRHVSPVARAEILYRLDSLLDAHTPDIVTTIVREHGKPVKDAEAEVSRARSITRFAAGAGRRLGGQTLPADDHDTMALTFRMPIGIVGLITPWNFPLAIPMWKLAPALVSGCTVVLKPSPYTPLTAAILVELLDKAGIPTGVVNLVQGGERAGAALAGDERVRGISFTGSVPVGRTIQVACAPRFARTQLELGGKNAVTVLADADLDRAAHAVVHGAFGQSGQRCSATSRVIVDRRIRHEFTERVTTLAGSLTVGPGDDPRSDLGPLINADRLEACQQAIDQACSSGAKLVLGGTQSSVAGRTGHYFKPTIVDNVCPEDTIATEEIFGPILTVLECDGFEHAVQLSNNVRYGMSATMFTSDLPSALASIRQLEAGMLHINRPGVGAYAHLPHVGTKASQYGPAECSPETFDFYTELRSACIDYSR